MSYFGIKPLELMQQVEQLLEYSSQLQDTLFKLRNPIGGYNVLALDYASALDEIAMQVMDEEISMRKMAEGLKNIVATYVETERNLNTSIETLSLSPDERVRYKNFKKVMCAEGIVDDRDIKEIFDHMSENGGQITSDYLKSKGYNISKESADLWGLIYNTSAVTDDPITYDLKFQEEQAAKMTAVLQMSAIETYQAYMMPKLVREPEFKEFNLKQTKEMGNTKSQEKLAIKERVGANVPASKAVRETSKFSEHIKVEKPITQGADSTKSQRKLGDEARVRANVPESKAVRETSKFSEHVKVKKTIPQGEDSTKSQRKLAGEARTSGNVAASKASKFREHVKTKRTITQGAGKAVKSDKYSNGRYTGGRTEQELKALEEDPAHSGSTRPIDIEKGQHEARVGLELEERGSLSNITRDATGKAEFIDGNGQAWDVKSFNSNYKPNKGGFRLDKAMNTIKKSLFENENVIVDTSNMSPEHIIELITEIKNQGLQNNILFWP